MHRLVLTLVAVGLLLPAAVAPSAAAPTSKTTLERKLARSLAAPGLGSRRTGAIAVDLRTGEVVFAHNAGRGLEPASVEKLTVAYTALSTLGPGFRFHTEVLGEGKRDGAVWHGDLVLRGYGDPTLGNGDIHSLAAQVRATGIRRVQGRVLGDESFFDRHRTAPGWKSSYYLWECPALSALVANRGVYRGRVTRWPAAAAAGDLRRALIAAGVAVDGRAYAADKSTNGAGDVLASAHSAPLWKILRFMAQQSDNFTAEMVVKELGAMQGDGGTTAAGEAVIRDTLSSAGISLTGVRLVDGSGLSRLDRMTARTLAQLLGSAWGSSSLHKPFVGALAVAGRSGTLADRLRGPATRGRVVAKTGTTFVASALAGFVNGHYAFAIINNGSPINAWTARVVQDRFVTILAQAG